MHNFITQKFEIIIIGAGGAGIMAALSALENGAKTIAVISKVFPTTSHTIAAKGGINAALGNKEIDDWRWHFYDTIKAGDYLADYDVVEYMCKNAPRAITNLEKIGVAFSRFKNGKIYQRAYGGQKTDFGKGAIAHRACSAKDDIGHAILHTLYQQSLKKGIKFFSEFFVIDLLMDKENKRCFGVVAIDLNSGQINVFESNITILATGGYSQIYQNATSANICTGDGAAMILRAGLELQDMEFVQFHPTSLYGTGLLVTEAARGEGAYLLNNLGERFMKNYAPNYLELASRDIVARAMASEIHEGRGCGANKDFLHLDLRHLEEKLIKEKLPGLMELAKNFAGIDVRYELLPTVPAAHYTMGGIPTNLNCQVTYLGISGEEKIVDGLMAVGEAACASAHGANRLGCNSLLDIIVFGELTGKIAAEEIKKSSPLTLPLRATTELEERTRAQQSIISKITAILKQSGGEKTDKIKIELQKINQQYAGIFKNQILLEQGLERLIALCEKLKLVEIKNKSLFWNYELHEYLETENLLLQSIAMIYSALKRTESRGAHFREDFPKRDDQNWLCHSLFSFKKIAEQDFEQLNQENFIFKTKKIRNKKLGGINGEIEIEIKIEERRY